jgi:AcrR family transcriptional regulator
MSASPETPADDVVVPKVPRARDAVASKESLLQAAQELFGQRGFERTTIRDIGERAGVDAALIARYFGSKWDLYFAAVAAEDSREQRPRRFEGLGQLADDVVSRADDYGPGPIMQALVQLDASDQIRSAALQRVRRRLVEPLTVDMIGHGVDRPELRAQIAVAAMLGISLSRSLGWFEELRTVPKDELVVLIAQALQEVVGTAADTNKHQPETKDQHGPSDQTKQAP